MEINSKKIAISAQNNKGNVSNMTELITIWRSDVMCKQSIHNNVLHIYGKLFLVYINRSPMSLDLFSTHRQTLQAPNIGVSRP